MCLIVFAWDPTAAAPLLLAANRDEFHRRPSAPLDYWHDAPDILAGRDLEAGGTWLGINRHGRFAAVTNVRDPGPGARTAPRSRGDLTREFLQGSGSAEAYLREVSARRRDYQGFNLLVGDGSALWYLHGNSGDSSPPRQLAAGIYGLSNAALDVPWPKVQRGRQRLREVLANSAGPPSLAALRECVGDRRQADTEALHGAGLQGEMAKRLSAQFIVTPDYGTRCCTVLRWLSPASLEIAEWRFGADGAQLGESEFAVDLNAQR